MSSKFVRIGYQGSDGSFSLMALREAMSAIGREEKKDYKTVPHNTFEKAVAAFDAGVVRELLLPVENNNSGRVEGMHDLLPDLHGWIVGEHFLPVQQCLLVLPGVGIDEIREVRSQKPAIDQCAINIKAFGFSIKYTDDTALAAKQVRNAKRRDIAAIASPLAGEIHKLETLGVFNDNPENHTRFYHIVHHSDHTRFLPDERKACITMVVIKGLSSAGLLFGPMMKYDVDFTRIERMIDGTFAPQELVLDLSGHIKAPHIRGCLRGWKDNNLSVQVKGCFEAQPRPV